MTPREQIQVGDTVRWWPDGYSPVIPRRHIDGEVTAMDGGRIIGIRITAHYGFTYRCPGGWIRPSVGSVFDPQILPGTIRRITAVTIPVGDIPIIADPTLRPDEIRMEPAEEPHVRRVFDRKDKIDRLNADLAAGKIRIAQPRMTAPRPSSHMGDAAAYAYSCIGVDWGSPEPPPKPPPTRPDGFAQSRIDEIKAMMLAAGRKR